MFYSVTLLNDVKLQEGSSISSMLRENVFVFGDLGEGRNFTDVKVPIPTPKEI